MWYPVRQASHVLLRQPITKYSLLRNECRKKGALRRATPEETQVLAEAGIVLSSQLTTAACLREALHTLGLPVNIPDALHDEPEPPLVWPYTLSL